MPSASRLLLSAAALVAGAVAGVLGSFVHPARLGGVPVGLVYGLVLSLAVFVTAGAASRSRTGAGAAALGWVVPVLLLSAPRPEGDLVVAGDALGYAWLLGGTVVAGLALAWPYAGTPASALPTERLRDGR